MTSGEEQEGRELRSHFTHQTHTTPPATTGKRKLLAAKEKDKDQLLLKAARNGDEKALRRALQQGFDVEAKQKRDGMTALNLACWKGHFEMAHALLEKKANANTTGNAMTMPLMGASVTGNGAMLYLLLFCGCQIHNAQRTPNQVPRRENEGDRARD
jgi:ankyrin repeat protein